MKKILFFISFLAISGLLKAQDNCMQFFPNTEGAILISKTSDANDNLLRSITYRIDKVYDYFSGSDMQIGFVITDDKGSVIDDGYLDASCLDGNFSMKMVNRGITPEVMSALSKDTELVGDYLDYPNIFDDDYPFESPFQMTGGEFTVQSKADKKDWVRVRVYNRQYVANEKITTPARVEPFHSAKVTFDFEVTKDKVTTQYKGVEWYAVNAGIVRSETYDSNDKLVNKTVLTTLKEK